jgi:hypothetical protein
VPFGSLRKIVRLSFREQVHLLPSRNAASLSVQVSDFEQNMAAQILLKAYGEQMEAYKRFSIFLISTLAVLGSPSSVLADDFVAYEGKDAIQEGSGGEKKTVAGIDFWSNGAPPRRFQLIGFITDSRMKTGLIGMIRMAKLESSIAKQAKKAGGDAVILTESGSETTGYVGQTHTTGQATATTNGNFYGNNYQSTTHAWGSSNAFSQTAAVRTQHSRYAVVKYLSDSDTGHSVADSSFGATNTNLE